MESVLQQEEWKDIKGFPHYMVSNLGRIKAKEHTQVTGFGACVFKEKILNGSDNGKGYFAFVPRLDGVKNKIYIHRVVAEAFIPNPENKPYVNHIDNNPENNHADNLEWCTHQENMDWMNVQGRAKRTPEWIEHLHKAQERDYKPVIATNISTGEVIVFPNLNSVKQQGFQPSCVCCCCKGTRNVKQHKGYTWRYA